MRNFVMSEEDLCAMDAKQIKRSISDHSSLLNNTKEPKVVGATNKSTSKIRFGDQFETSKSTHVISRESDEVAAINNLPWNKQQQFRNVTPYYKVKNKDKHQKQTTDFHPVNLTRSTDDLLLENVVVRPIPILASKSYQDLSNLPDSNIAVADFFTQTKSIDDLLLNDIDGIGKVQGGCSRYRLKRPKPLYTSSSNAIYQNLIFGVFDEEKQIRKPLPRPRNNMDGHPKNTSRKLTYVLDPEKDEFILENEEILSVSEIDLKFNQVFEDSFSNDETVERDSSTFNTLVVDQFTDPKNSKFTFGDL